jgi:hypothetical protein
MHQEYFSWCGAWGALGKTEKAQGTETPATAARPG